MSFIKELDGKNVNHGVAAVSCHFTFDAIIPRNYGAHQFMRMNRQARSPWARLFVAICTSLFVIATVGFPLLHVHKHSDKQASERCNVCVAHPTSSSA